MKRYIKFISFLLLVLVVTGCDDFLGKNPTNRAELQTVEDIRAMLVSAYPETSYFVFTEVMSDNVTDVGDRMTDDVTRRKYYHWQQNNDMAQDTPNGFFTSCYTAIAASNHVLRAIDRMLADSKYTEADVNPYKAEALLTRAYNHFMLVNLFAEHYNPATAESDLALPYVTTVEEEPSPLYERLTVKQMYDKIEADMLEGYALLDENLYPETAKWHFNKEAAGVFISRFYLYRGLMEKDENGEDDFDKVIRYLTETVGTSPKIRDWTTSYNDPLEDFLTDYCSSLEDANLLLISTVSTGSCYRVWANRYTMNSALMQRRFSYETPHPTKNSIDYLLGYKVYGNSTLGCYSLFTLNEYFKRDGINANFGIPYVMFPAIVAEEALFNLAEAYVMKERYEDVIALLDFYYSKRAKGTGTGELYNSEKHKVLDEKINEIYNGNLAAYNVSLKPSYALNERQATYLRCLMNIKASEFCGQGMRWFDIKRMHMPVTHEVFPNQTITLTADDARRIIPMSDDAQRGMVPTDPTASIGMMAKEKALTLEQIKAPKPFKREEMKH